tara:strand:+ start:175 stop:543 length:369 start_codon:yes stop_codon:yes gene_type:complete
MFNQATLSYCASFIDGEGYIEWCVRPKKNGKGKIYNTHIYRLELCNTDQDLIKSIHKDFGEEGTLNYVKPRITDKGTWTKPQLVWHISYRKFYRLLRLVLPFMRQKDKVDKAQAIVEWVESR